VDVTSEAVRENMKRRHYEFLLDDQKVKVAKYASEHGVTSSV